MHCAERRHRAKARVELPQTSPTPTAITPASHAAAGARCLWRFAALLAAGPLLPILFALRELANEFCFQFEQSLGVVAKRLIAVLNGIVANSGRIHSASPHPVFKDPSSHNTCQNNRLDKKGAAQLIASFGPSSGERRNKPPVPRESLSFRQEFSCGDSAAALSSRRQIA